MSKRKGLIMFIILVITASLIGIVYCILASSKVIYVTDNEFLYDIAIDYLKEKYTKEEKEYNKKDDFNIFFDYKGFGISEKGNKKYAYMWILQESYYIEDGKLQKGSGSSMPYKVTFENNKVIDYEIPKDGTYYEQSIRKMFPDDIENKILGYNFDNTKLNNEVKEYYSNNKVRLKLKEGSLETKGATFIMENNTNLDYYYGPEYSIEIKENDEWKTLETEEPLVWNTVVWTLKSKESQEITIDWSIGYEKLEAGEYRLVKKLTPKTNETGSSIKIYAEFEIK